MVTNFDTFMNRIFGSGSGAFRASPVWAPSVTQPLEGPPVPTSHQWAPSAAPAGTPSGPPPPSQTPPTGSRTSSQYAYVIFDTPQGPSEVLVPLERTAHMPQSARIVGDPITDPDRLDRAEQAGYLWEQLPPDQRFQFGPASYVPAGPVEGPPLVLMSTDGGGRIPMALDPGAFASGAGVPLAFLRQLTDRPEGAEARAKISQSTNETIDDGLDWLLGLFR